MRAIFLTLKTAMNALRRNVLRSALTTLGIIIGVAAVIATVGIGEGSKKAVAKTIQSMGANNLLVQPGTASTGGVSFGSGSIMTLTPQDAVVIAHECRSVIVSVAPVVRARTQVVLGNKNWVPLYIYGTTPDFLDVRQWDMDEGRNFTDQEVYSSAEVCVIGQTIVRELFNGQSPVGHVVRINNHPMTVVGTLTRKGANMMGVDQDDIVLAPWRTIKYKVSGSSAQTGNQSNSSQNDNASIPSEASQRYPSQQPSPYPVLAGTETTDYPPILLPANVDQILVRVASENVIPSAIRQITGLLHERHHIRAGQPDDFNIRDMTELSKAMGSTSELISQLLLIVAGVSLLVGGVGIMNIMMVSVTERTREIGLRMAVGARSRDILRQFLVEAVVLCLIGGAIGILFGCGGVRAVRFFKNWPTELSLLPIVAAVGVSAAVGVIFGFYPAWKASRLDPIEALRYE
ncbi:MAG TPA: ABC transporter permease [Gemmataceae bacterium]|nr:ABC transporter permease [Gemmataceae bacterium]